MTDRPILFSGPMVRAILEGRKTVTRRIFKLRPLAGSGFNPRFSGLEAGHYCTGAPASGWVLRSRGAGSCWNDRTERIHCPYGVPGDRLWVRETWGYRGAAWSNQRPDRHEVDIAYQADGSLLRLIRHGPEWDRGLPSQHPPPAPKHDADFEAIEARNDYFSRWWKSWRPSIHMPRWASRLTLEVVSVRVERLQEIGEDDAKAEGVRVVPDDPFEWSYRRQFQALWSDINGKRAPWESNPWVWVVEFTRVP